MKRSLFILLGKRVFTSLILLLMMIILLFFLLRIAPGDPVQKFISPELSPELAERIKESFNLNNSLWEQFTGFVSNIFQGNFGISYTYRLPVVEVIKEYFPFTLFFSLLSFMLQITLSLILALISIKKISGFIDNFFMKSSLIVYALPSFLIGVVLIFFFSELIPLLPSSGIKSFDYESYNFFEKVLDYIKHLILPLLTLSLGGTALFYRYLRDNLEEIFNKTFIINLKANGFTDKEIIKKHVIPNAVFPLISIAGVELGILLGGTLITEVIFGLPGMGRLTINAILSRDYPLVLGATFTAGVMVIISNLLADILKAKIDKRLLSGI